MSRTAGPRRSQALSGDVASAPAATGVTTAVRAGSGRHLGSTQDQAFESLREAAKHTLRAEQQQQQQLRQQQQRQQWQLLQQQRRRQQQQQQQQRLRQLQEQQQQRRRPQQRQWQQEKEEQEEEEEEEGEEKDEAEEAEKRREGEEGEGEGEGEDGQQQQQGDEDLSGLTRRLRKRRRTAARMGKQEPQELGGAALQEEEEQQTDTRTSRRLQLWAKTVKARKTVPLGAVMLPQEQQQQGPSQQDPQQPLQVLPQRTTALPRAFAQGPGLARGLANLPPRQQQHPAAAPHARAVPSLQLPCLSQALPLHSDSPMVSLPPPSLLQQQQPQQQQQQAWQDPVAEGGWQQGLGERQQQQPQPQQPQPQPQLRQGEAEEQQQGPGEQQGEQDWQGHPEQPEHLEPQGLQHVAHNQQPQAQQPQQLGPMLMLQQLLAQTADVLPAALREGANQAGHKAQPEQSMPADGPEDQQQQQQQDPLRMLQQLFAQPQQVGLQLQQLQEPQPPLPALPGSANGLLQVRPASAALLHDTVGTHAGGTSTCFHTRAAHARPLHMHLFTCLCPAQQKCSWLSIFQSFTRLRQAGRPDRRTWCLCH